MRSTPAVVPQAFTATCLAWFVCACGQGSSSSDGDSRRNDASFTDAATEAAAVDAPLDASTKSDASLPTDGPFDETTSLEAASPPDARASTDAALPVDPCSAPGTFVCDDFEQATLDPGKWMAVNVDANNTLTLDKARFRTGSQSLHVAVQASAGSALIQTLALPALPNNTIWGRAYMYFAAPAPMTHAGVVIAEGTWPAGHVPMQAEYNFGMQNGMWLTDYKTDNGENPANSCTNVATGHWSCVEWHFKGDTGDFEEYLDGSLVQGANAQAQPVPPFHDVQLGLDLCCDDSQAVKTFDLWIDAVAIGTQRIGCL